MVISMTSFSLPVKEGCDMEELPEEMEMTESEKDPSQICGTILLIQSRTDSPLREYIVYGSLSSSGLDRYLDILDDRSTPAHFLSLQESPVRLHSRSVMIQFSHSSQEKPANFSPCSCAARSSTEEAHA